MNSHTPWSHEAPSAVFVPMPAEDWSSALIESECWWSCVGPQTFHDQLWVLLLQRVKKFNRLVATAASYCSTSLKFSELFSVTPSFTKVCTGRLHSWVCDCIHLQQQEFKDSDRCGPEVVNFRLADIGDLNPNSCGSHSCLLIFRFFISNYRINRNTECWFT